MDPVFLTPGQQRYFGGTAENQNEMLAITGYDHQSSSIMVEKVENLGEDGSGVWVDASGTEQHGPSGS